MGPKDQRRDQRGRRRATQKDAKAFGLHNDWRAYVGDAERPSADAVRQSADTKGLGATQTLVGLTLSLREAPKDLSLLGEPIWHPSCTQEKLINKILLCCTDFPAVGFFGDKLSKVTMLMCLILVHVFVSV